MLSSPRLKKILNIILKLEPDQYVTIDFLASALKTSRRTIFRELENVNDLLTGDGLKLESRTGKGIRIEGPEPNREALLEALSADDISYVNKEERRKLLAFELLRDESVRKLIYYANMFQVSEATVSNDMDALVPLFEEHGIRIIRKGKNRIEISGSESRKRNAMMQIVHQQMPGLDSAEPGICEKGLADIFMGGASEGIMSLLNQDILRRVLQVFDLNQHELNLDRFSQPAYIGLILHLVIAVDRILKNESISSGSDVAAMLRDDSSFEEAREISRWLENEFDIEIPDVEIAFIAMHLQGSKVSFSRENLDSENPDEEVMQIADEFINGYSPQIQIALRHDEQFLTGLVTHLEPALIRIRNHLPIYNPLLDQLKNQYSDLFDSTRKAADRMEKLMHLKISDEEAGFITMHVGAALERNSLSALTRPIRVGIVCASGIGVSALLAARVQKQFHAQVQVRTLSMEEIRNRDYRNSELLLSTFPLASDSIETVQVSPLLSDQDIERIRNRLDLLLKQSAESLRDGSENSSYPEKLNRLSLVIESQKQILAGLKTVKTDTKSSRDRLIYQSAALLKGDTEQICSDFLKREELGSVIADDYGFAMFHAATAGVSCPQFVLLYPENEFFSIPGFEKIRFIAAAAVPDKAERPVRETVSLLSSSLIENNSFLRAVSSRDRQQIEEKISSVFRKQLEQLFQSL